MHNNSRASSHKHCKVSHLYPNLSLSLDFRVHQSESRLSKPLLTCFDVLPINEDSKSTASPDPKDVTEQRAVHSVQQTEAHGMAGSSTLDLDHSLPPNEMPNAWLF